MNTEHLRSQTCPFPGPAFTVLIQKWFACLVALPKLLIQKVLAKW